MKPTGAHKQIVKLSSSNSIAWARGLCWIGAINWWLCLKAFSSRSVYLLHNGSTSVASPALEVLVPSRPVVILVAGLALLAWIAVCELLNQKHSKLASESTNIAVRHWLYGSVALCFSSAPWLVDLALHWNIDYAFSQAQGLWGPTLWQPLWLAAFSGLAADRLARAWQTTPGRTSAQQSTAARQAITQAQLRRRVLSPAFIASAGVCLCSAMCGAWWYAQSQHAYASFMLGFNDCGHFVQRIANTAAGRGWLIESPVLPAFWDHFNPGLTLLVPLWWIWPSMNLVFLFQAICLAGSAPLVMWLARLLGASALASALWAIAWLLQPIVGQMNLAYSYGWHPISLAIPLLLLSLGAILLRRWLWAILGSVLACSIEEGVIVVVATTAATMAAVELAAHITLRLPWERTLKEAQPPYQSLILMISSVRRISSVLPTATWIAIAAVATIAFVLIYGFSGLAKFQTGRFHTLGSTPLEIMLSPVTRAEFFWGGLFRSRNAIFLLGLTLPCYVIALSRAWLLLLPLVLPLGVLLVWDHLPAQSLAFHYASSLLPLMWLCALVGATSQEIRSPGGAPSEAAESKTAEPTRGNRIAESFGWAACVTSLVASFSFGQFPWSIPTLADVEAKTFLGEMRRQIDDLDNDYAHAQLLDIRQKKGSVLATGRLATHLVGARDLETVGQFVERRERLSQLTPGKHPLLRYETLILDRLENFQQQREQTAALEQEAKAIGFRVVADQYEIVTLTQ